MSTNNATIEMDRQQLLQWYLNTGVDEAIGSDTVDYFTAPAIISEVKHSHQAAGDPSPLAQDDRTSTANTESRIPTPLHHTPSAAMANARALADKATTLAELEEAVRGFDGCAIKKTASKTVFSDGNAEQPQVMIIGEAPGAQEDIQGIPFCGPSGMLLDRMLASIGLTRKDSAYISNTVFWRPPGNRQPSQEETAICLPFVEKHIALIQPKLLVLSGGTATTTLLRKDTSVSRLRGKFYDYTNPYLQAPIPVAVTYHPSYLLRSPAQKRLAWHDLLMMKNHLDKSS